MNIDKIREIVNSKDLPPEMMESYLLQTLAEDPNLIPQLLKLLQIERQRKDTCMVDMNLELSRAHVFIDEWIDKEKEKRFNRSFILDEIAKFYIKYSGMVTHCFNRFVKEKTNV